MNGFRPFFLCKYDGLHNDHLHPYKQPNKYIIDFILMQEEFTTY